jgi:hypothetical protein
MHNLMPPSSARTGGQCGCIWDYQVRIGFGAWQE